MLLFFYTMTKAEITINGKTVGLAYCYATEIEFRKSTGKNIDEFNPQDPEHVVDLILAAIVPYYQAKGEEAPVQRNDLMFDVKPADIVELLREVFKLRAEWYDVPLDDQEEKVEADPKND